MIDSYYIPHIQNVRQSPDLCGPAALATVLSYWGMEITETEVAAGTFCPAMRGTHGADMLLFAMNRGLRAYSYRSSIRDLKEKTSRGVPVVVRQMASATAPTPHYRVVVGYDSTGLVVLDPDRPGTWRISHRKFNRLWRPCGRWALLVVPVCRNEFTQLSEMENSVYRHDLTVAYRRTALCSRSLRK